MLDIFNDDAFGVRDLSDSVEHLPYVPGVLNGLFTPKPLRVRNATIEVKDNALQLIPVQVPGAPPTQNARSKRRKIPVSIPHLPTSDTVMAEDVAGLAAFGEEDRLESAMEMVQEVQSEMKQNLETTLAYHRAGAVAGHVLDADGASTVINLFDTFGVTETSISVNFTTPTNIKATARTLKSNTRTALGSTSFRGLRALCGSDFFTNLIQMDEVKAAYERYQENLFAREDQGLHGTGGFPYAGIFWEEFDYNVGSVDFISSMKARVYPVGVPQLFRVYYAPAAYMQTVNRKAKPYYTSMEKLPHDTGMEIEMQSNPLHLCTRPKCLQELAGTV